MRAIWIGLLLSSIVAAQPSSSSPPDPHWRTVGAGASAGIPALCNAGRDVYICNGAGCTTGQNIYYCTATNTWNAQGTAAGSGITSLNGLVGATQTFVNDTNITITSAGSTHTLGFSGTLAKSRTLASTVYTDQSNTFSSGTQDYTSAAHLIVKNGNTISIPATCTIGEVYFATDATAGLNWYFCTATNVWTQQLTSGNATQINGAVVPQSAAVLASNASRQLITPSITGSGNVVMSASPTFTGTASFASILASSLGGTGVRCVHVDNTGLLSVAASDCGSGGGSSVLSALTAATGANTIASGDNAQVWQWSLSTASKSAFTFGESAASTSTGTPVLVNIQTLAASTANPFQVTAGGTANGIQVNASGVLAPIGTGHISADELTGTLLSSLSTGLMKVTTGTGTVTTAVSGTDYAPATSGSGVLKGNGSGGFANAGTTDIIAAGWVGANCGTGTNYLLVNGACGVPGGQAAVYTAVVFSATPTFTATSNTVNSWSMASLTANVTSSTLSGASAGEILNFKLCQDATGGRTFAWPTGFSLAPTISPIASACTKQSFLWDGSSAVPIGSASVDAGPSIPVEIAAPGTPTSGEYCWWDSTAHLYQCKDSSANLNSIVRTASGGTSHQWVDYVATTGIPHTSQPAFTDISGTLALTSLATQAADTTLINATGGAAAPTAVAIPSCSAASSALQYNTTTHTLGCGTITAGGAALSSLTAAAGANSINNGDNAQTWNWSLTTASKSAFTFGENVASTSTGTPFLVNIQTLAASTLNPLQVTALGTANGVRVDTAGHLAKIGTGSVDADKINGTAFSGTQNDIVTFGAANVPADSGVLIGNVPTMASNATASGQILQPGGANKTIVANDFADAKSIPFCINVNGTVAVGVTTTTAVTCTARAGTNNKTAFYGPFTTSDAIVFPAIHLPKDWNTGGSIGLSVDMASTDTTSGHTIILQAASECSKLDGSTTDDVAFNAAQSLSTVTLNTTANQTWTATLSALTTTGCSAPGILWVKITRTTDTATNVELYGAEVTIPRRPVVQAN